MTESIRWFFRGGSDNAHRAIGKTLGLSEVSDPGRLHESVRCADGEWALWDCDGFAFERSKEILISARKRGYPVFLYKQVGDEPPAKWEEDEEVRKALEEHPGREKGKKAAAALKLRPASSLKPPKKRPKAATRR